MSLLTGFLLTLCAGVAAEGYGSALVRFLRIRANLGDRGIVGLLCIGVVGCILHLLIPLSVSVQVVVLAAGAIMASVFQRDIRSDASIGPGAVAGLLTFALVRNPGQPNFDYGLYYLQTLKWNREFPVTLGLANLHGRLAFNSMVFLIAPFTDRIATGWILNLLVVTFVIVSLCARFRSIDLTDRRSSVELWFGTLVVSFFVIESHYWTEILSADSVVAGLIVYWTALSLGFSRSSDKRSVFALLLISAVLATTIKISAGPLLVVTMALGWFHGKKAMFRDARVCGTVAVVLAAWMVHGVLLSGCAVYPVRQTCLSGLSWAASQQQVNDERMAIQSWARKPGDLHFARVLQDWSWFPHWFARIRRESRLIQFLGAAIPVGALAFVFAGAKIRRQPRDDLALIAASLAACLGFWFWSAPDVRFGQGFILAAAAFGFGMAGAAWMYQPRLLSYLPRALMLLVVVFGMRNLMRLRAESFSYTIPKPAVYQFRTAQGVGLWVPREGENQQCWGQRLPCTPYVELSVLGRVRWPAAWPYHYDPELEPPLGWKATSGWITSESKVGQVKRSDTTRVSP